MAFEPPIHLADMVTLATRAKFVFFTATVLLVLVVCVWVGFAQRRHRSGASG